jgi:Polyketide cyclase / dehydrase and lipid transport
MVVRGDAPAARTRGMRAMKRSIHIEAPVETVFDSFMDPVRLWDLMPIHTELDDVKVTKEGVGTYESWHFKIAGLPVRGFDVLTDVVPNKHITSRSSKAMMGTWDYDFESEGSGTKVTMEHHPGSFWRIPPLRNLMDLVTERMNDTFMARVKDTIETQGN